MKKIPLFEQAREDIIARSPRASVLQTMDKSYIGLSDLSFASSFKGCTTIPAQAYHKISRGAGELQGAFWQIRSLEPQRRESNSTT